MDERKISGNIRPAVVNGIFYPNSREAVAARLASWGIEEGSAVSVSGKQAILVPHGAWDHTGESAGAAFAAVQKTGAKSAPPASRVLLLGIPHNQDAEEGIYLSESDLFETPLGHIPVDQNLNVKLASCSSLVKVNDIPHLSEHSLEVLLPFVKFCFPGAMIIPVLVSGSRPVLVNALAGALRAVFENYREETLIVVSSNVSMDSDAGVALSMAGEFCSLLSEMNARSFLAALAGRQISACGGVLAASLLESGLLDGGAFSALSPLGHHLDEDNQVVYYGAFGCA